MFIARKHKSLREKDYSRSLCSLVIQSSLPAIEHLDLSPSGGEESFFREILISKMHHRLMFYNNALFLWNLSTPPKKGV